MTDTANTPSTRPKPKLNNRQRKARNAYMRSYFARRRAKFLEALAMLEKIGDDDVIIIEGRK